MGKKYKVRLLINEGDDEALKDLSRIYRKAYNVGIEIQFKHLSYSEDYMSQLIPAERVMELIESSKVSFSKIDTGIVEAGIRDSVEYFHSWWLKRLTTHSTKTTVPLTPSHLQARNGIFFKTTSQLKISEQEFIYIPKYGRIKIKNLHRVPPGTYKNIKIEFDGVTWDLMLESAIDEEPVQIEFLKDSLDVEVSEDGSTTVEDMTTTSILEFEWFEKSEKKINSLKKKLKRQKPNSKGFLDTTNKLSHTQRKLMSQITTYYKFVSNRILLGKPRELTIRGAQFFEGDSEISKQSRVKVLLQVLKGKADRMGIKVIIKGIKNEMFVIKK